MASHLAIQDDAVATASVQPADLTVSDVVPDAASRTGNAVEEPRRLPDICSLQWQREGMPDTEFNRRYPPDAWGDEAAPHARVWKVYRDYQTVSDRGMLASWNKTLDVLLIFAGLFSAVSTAFLIESYKALQPDYTHYVAAFLYAAAVSHNRTGSIVPALDEILSPDRFIQTSSLQRWTNGLWFSSLVISLAVALLCILIKQWLDAYDSHVSFASSSPMHWARRHSLYYRGLKMWGVPVLISFLPLLLHVSLFLFFGGILLLLLPLDGTIAYSLLVMVSCIASFYVLALVLPAWCVECPSYTPLLEQALLAASGAISGMLYIIMSLERCVRYSSRPLLCALCTLALRAERWLVSIQTRATGQFAREGRTMSTSDLELDGYILSALVHQPTDTNRDIVNAGCTAIGAITSTRTIEIISSNVPGDVFTARINDCYDNIPSAETGFAITSHAQLRRAHEAMWFRNAERWGVTKYPGYAPGLLSSLGIDGLLLRAMGVGDGEMPPFDIANLFRSLQSIPLVRERSCEFPLRSMCLLFLEHFSDWYPQPRPFVSCFLLVLCAGRFGDADMHELVRALRSVASMLKYQCSIALLPYNGGDEEYICAVINGLWMMLADSGEYLDDNMTAQTIAHQAAVCFNSSRDYSTPGFVLAQLSGLLTFVRSTTFDQCVGTGDSLDQYISLFSSLWILDYAEVTLEDYWKCSATLLKLSWERVPWSRNAAYLTRADRLFPVEPSDWNYAVRLSAGGPYATQDDWYEPALSAFLVGPNAIATWTVAGSPDRDAKGIIELACLALRISIVLCRRKHLGRANDTFIHGIFSGTFLLARFRDVVSRLGAHIPSQEGEINSEDLLLDLAKHCLKLSPAHFVAVLAQLDESGEAGSELRTRATASGQRLRDGSEPGGELTGECAADCPCMIVGKRRPCGWRDGLASPFRRSRSAVAPAENV